MPLHMVKCVFMIDVELLASLVLSNSWQIYGQQQHKSMKEQTSSKIQPKYSSGNDRAAHSMVTRAVHAA